MPRLYLHLRDGVDLCEDPDGGDYPSIADARDEAIQGAREIMSDHIKFGERMDHCVIEIVDEEGRVVLLVPFQEAFTARA